MGIFSSSNNRKFPPKKMTFPEFEQFLAKLPDNSEFSVRKPKSAKGGLGKEELIREVEELTHTMRQNASISTRLMYERDEGVLEFVAELKTKGQRKKFGMKIKGILGKYNGQELDEMRSELYSHTS